MRNTPPQPITLPKVEISMPNVDTKVEQAVFINYPTALTPRSPVSEYGYCDYDFVTDIYRFGSVFNMECSNTLEDIEYFDCSELLTPVFD